jgi:NADPH2:quinone reductase
LLLKTRPVEGLQAGDHVLFHAAAGGVGLIACQWGKALGFRMIGTAGSDAKCQLAIANGAEHCINYSSEDFLARVKEITGGKGLKVVYDSVGKDTWEKSLDCLRPFGLMATFGNASGAVPPFAPGVLGVKGSLYVTRQTLFSHITTRESTQAMADDLFAVVQSGKVKIHIDQTFPLAQVQEAHRALEARKTTGCTILTLELPALQNQRHPRVPFSILLSSADVAMSTSPSNTQQFVQDQQACAHRDGTVGHIESREVPSAVVEV